MAYEIDLESFKGPLDLLLHLIKKNEMDIYDIPIAEITGQYLSAIDAMQSLNLDVVGEFLVMAATLLHIKSRMLLPDDAEESEEAEIDPRADLVHRLLEYQKYKDAASSLERLPLLGRDVFVRDDIQLEPEEDETDDLAPVGLYELAEAFKRLLKEKDTLPAFHKVEKEMYSVTDCLQEVLTALTGRGQLSFCELFVGSVHRGKIIAIFLAMLELVKMRLVRLMQNSRCGTIWLYPGGDETLNTILLEDQTLGYK